MGSFSDRCPRLAQRRKFRIEADSHSVWKAKARSIRAGLWRCVISIAVAKTLPELLLGGNEAWNTAAGPELC